jgi:lipopolysaccharide export LptBFGC system permease protein LptF
MSRTLFIYIFRDLMRIFLLALLSLAVIMSFGGLMRPLTRQGLQPTQIGQALLFLLPAMMTYALPIAALFGTTFVYGRLSADNEITACRAGGISYLSMVTPALLLGLIVSIVSLFMLCFIVPGLTLRVEQLATSNLARWIAFEIERDHQVKRNDWPYTIFAQSASLPDQTGGDQQIVVLKGPMIVTYDRAQVMQSKYASAVHIPKNFWLAKEATVYITNLPGDKVQLSGRSTNGTMFDRVMHGDRGGTTDATFGPMEIPMGVREHPKFMDIRQLKNLLADRSQSERLQDSFKSLIQHDEEQNFLAAMLLKLNTTQTYTFDNGTGEKYILTKPGLSSPTSNGVNLASIESPAGAGRAITIVEQNHGETVTDKATRVQIRIDVDQQDHFMVIALIMGDVDQTEGAELDRRIYVPMSPDVAAVANQTLQKYLDGPDVPMNAPATLRHEIVQLTNYIYSEMHGRVSFAVSCLILVAAGAALGLMFKSGNFLSAFAVSVVPALLAIALVATGQHVVEGVPGNVTQANDPIHLGIAIIWSGNVAALAVAVTLLGRLQRQ